MDTAIKNFFYPASVCIPGASSREKSIGYELLRSIKSYGYTGRIFPVNPGVEEILGIRSYPSVTAVPGNIDLAVIAVPFRLVEDTVEELLSKGVKSIIIVTAGFKETGSEGAQAENLIAGKLKAAGARLVGPNCMGVISTMNDIKLNATFVAEKPVKGSTAFLSQSGAIGAAVLNSLRETDIKFAHFISVGNKADISENDLLEFWAEDENIRTVTMYLESFEKGESLLFLSEKLKAAKPVIILKAGRSEAGIKAALSHTGAMGSSDKVVGSLLKQFGIIRAETLNELFNTAKGFENFPLPGGNKIAVITNAGGPAILAVDSFEKNGLALAELTGGTKEKLREIIRSEGSVSNPVDLLPGGTPEQYKAAINILTADPNTDAVISLFVEPVMVPAFDVIESVNSVASGKPVYQVVMPLPEFWNDYRTNSRYGKPLFKNPEDPAKVVSNILLHLNKKDRNGILKPGRKVVKLRGHGILKPEETFKLIKKYKIPVPAFASCQPAGLKDAALKVGFPAVIKGISKEVIHKSDEGAVFIDINSLKDLKSAGQKIKENFFKRNITSYELLVQEYIKVKHELLVGGFRDRSFGPVVMFGSGGKYVEITGDTAVRSAYLSAWDIDELIEETKIGRILKGVRGEKPAALKKIKKIINAAARMLLDYSEITEFDFNPVIISDEGEPYAVDIRIRTE